MGDFIRASFRGMHLIPIELGLPVFLPAPCSPALCVVLGLSVLFGFVF